MSTKINGRYAGESGALFGLYIKTAILTLITLGIYRFWAKTRIRKYVWSAITGDGDSFEYTGTGLEKFLGFLVAIVILAIYLGIVQMILFFFGIYLFDEPVTTTDVIWQVAGIYITLFAVIPLLFFAQYRARRYKMSRTRWRGLRFGMDSAAWAYVGRAILHTLLTIITLGILLPRQTFYLEKYMADRTWYGDAQFRQDGRWSALYRGLKHVVIGVAIVLAGILFGAVLGVPSLMTILIFVGYIWLVIGLVYYQIYSFNYLTSNKSLDGEVVFDAVAQTGEVIKVYIIGGLIIIGVGIVAGIALAVLMGGMIGFGFLIGDGIDSDAMSVGAGIFGAIIGVVGYVAVLLIIGGISLVMITQKIIAHMVESVTVHNTEHLDTIRQRAADKGADAEGFADALDIGGAI